MMKHELEDQLKAFEKKGIDRRHFFQTDGNGRFTDCCKYPKRQKHFQAKPKGKIVIIGGGAAGISMAARLKELAGQAGYHFDRSQ